MIGLIALAILFFWIFFANKISIKISQFISSEKIRKITRPILFILVFCAPVIDEIISGFQFRYLCNKDSISFVNKEKAKEKILVEQSNSIKLTGYIVPIEKFTNSFKDINTNEIVVSWVRYKANGGLLARAIDLGSSSMPFTFDGNCRPEYSGMVIVKELDITLQSKFR